MHPKTIFRITGLIGCGASESPFRWRDQQAMPSIEMRLRALLLRIKETKGKGIHIVINGWEGFTTNKEGFLKPFNHWTNGMLHIHMPDRMLTFEILKIVTAIRENIFRDQKLKELSKAWQWGTYRRAIFSIAAPNIHDKAVGVLRRNSIGKLKTDESAGSQKENKKKIVLSPAFIQVCSSLAQEVSLQHLSS